MVWNRKFGKKKKEEFDPFQDLVLSKLKVGYLVDYDLKTWDVTLGLESDQLMTNWQHGNKFL